MCIGKKENGGGETLHQLVDSLNRQGYDAYVIYPDDGRDSIVPEMRKYNVKLALRIEDISNNILICPEMYTSYMRKYNSVTKVIWFLSKEYYLESLPEYKTSKVLKKNKLPIILFPLVFCAVLLKTESSLFSYKLSSGKVKYFLYNVESAKNLIIEMSKGEYYAQYLCGPVNDIYFENLDVVSNQKEKIVAYNPRKSTDFMNSVIDYFGGKRPEIEFIPIQNMNQQEVKKLLNRASVYMDFGTFPGPERIPREAVMMKCNIVTSVLGCAANQDDVPINKKYKFSFEQANLPFIYDTVCELVDNYENHVQEFDEYRNKVMNQKLFFDHNVKVFIEKIKND